jgi:hypothetical protein
MVFSDALEPASAQDPQHFQVKMWSLKRTENYGSNHYGEHGLQVTEARLSSDHKIVELEIPDLQPTWSMEIKCELRGADGTAFQRTIHNSIYSLHQVPR